MKRPHFVVVGLGSIGRRHAGNLARLRPDAAFTFVRRTTGGEDLSGHVEARVVTDIRDVLDAPVDLVVLSTPSANHMDVLPELIDRACPLLVEKPVVTERHDLDAVAARLADAPPAPRAVGFNLRFLPSLRRLHHEVEAGRLGSIARASFIAGQWLPDWRPAVDYRSSYSADARRGGGVELDLAHEFDAARWLLGDLGVAFSRGGTLSSLELRSHDTSVSVLAPSDACGPVATVALDYLARRRVRWYEVVGDEGRAQWDLDGRLELWTADGGDVLTDPSAFDVAQTYVTMMEAMLTAGETGVTTSGGLAALGLQSLADGLESTRLAIDARDRGGPR